MYNNMNVYTVEEVSKILKLPENTIRKYLRLGKLRGSKLGRAWRVTEEQIKFFLTENANIKGEK